MIKRRFKVAILIVIVVLALGLIISYAATGKQNSRMTSNTSTSYISQGVIGMKVSTLVSNLDKAGVSNSYTLNAVSATRGGAYVHTTDADYYYDNYDKAGKPAINSTIQKIYLTPNYKDPIAKDLYANFCLPGLRDLAMLYPASSEASMTDTVSTLAVYLKANGSEIGYYWENGVGDPEQVSANYICITKPDSKHAHVGGLGVIDGLEDNEEMYRYNNVVLANRPTNSDDTFDDDGGEKISEFDFKSIAAQNIFGLKFDDIIRDWDVHQGKALTFKGQVTYMDKDDYVTTMLIETITGKTFACVFYENVPVVKGDWLAVWGYATELTSYTTTNPDNVTTSHTTFLLEGKYYETNKTKDSSNTFTADEKKLYFGHTYVSEAKQPAADHTKEITLTESTINGEPYHIKEFKRDLNGVITVSIILSNYEGSYFNAGGYHGIISFYPSGRISIDDLRAFDGTNDFKLNTIDWATGISAYYVSKDAKTN